MINDSLNQYLPKTETNYEPIRPLENKCGNPKNNNGNWNTCSPASLRGRIVNAHFQARTLANLGVARYDLEVAKYRNMSVDWVVQQAYKKLERDDADILTEIKEHKVADKLTVAGYRTMLVKNLKYIRQLGLATIDWERVNKSINSLEIASEIEQDSHDMSFRKDVVPFLPTENRYY